MPNSGIFVTEPVYKKAKFWQIVIVVGFVLLFLYAFWGEVGLFFQLIRFLFGGAVLPPAPQEFLRAFVIMVINVFAFVTFFFLSLLLVSQFVLPVLSSEERSKVFNRLLLYFTGGHGPAIFVKEGQEKGRAEEIKSSRPGVAFVDLCSAIALEKHWVPVVTTGVAKGRVSPLNFLNPGRLLRMISPRPQAKRKTKPMVRVAGPGIVFTEWGERIRDVADLRRHVKAARSVGVSTRDGFAVKANVTTIFTIGEEADIIKVAYVDGWEQENLLGIKVDEKKKIIIGFSDEFDLPDKSEIHQYILNYVPTKKSVDPSKKKAKDHARPPYSFDEQRVFAALYSRAHNVPSGMIENWTNLPTIVAVEIFRDMLSQEDYNALYKPEDPDSFPFLESFVPIYRRAVRNLGILAFQFVRRKDRLPLTKDQPWDEKSLEFYPVQQLHTPKVLRERGIKIIAASISELSPVHPGVRGQLVEFWQARWQQEAELTEAEAALAALKVQAKARAEAQEDMIKALSQIFEDPALSREALTLRLFQALETAATDPKTKSLLPGETLNVLWHLRQFLSLSGGG